jgi:hypothetical protein
LCLQAFFLLRIRDAVEVNVLTMRLAAVGFGEDYGLVERNGLSGLDK